MVSKKVLTNGFIKVVDVSPRIIPTEYSQLKCDYSIAEAARVSYGKGTKKISDDISLIHYLYSHQHTTPFEMVTFKFHIRAPIFVVRQWQRHRMSSYNEISARYSVLDDSLWTPEVLRSQSLINKQSSANDLLNNELISEWKENNQRTFELYKKSLDYGVSRELARVILPLGTYTEFYWKIDLHNLLRFIKLRSASNAQNEIREYSRILKEILKEYTPESIKAFENFTENSITFSESEIKVLNGIPQKLSRSGNDEFLKKLKLINRVQNEE